MPIAQTYTHAQAQEEGAGACKTIDVRPINDRRSWQELKQRHRSCRRQRQRIQFACDSQNAEMRLCERRKLTQGTRYRTRYKIQDANSFSDARSASRTELSNVIDMQPPPPILVCTPSSPLNTRMCPLCAPAVLFAILWQRVC